MNNVAVIGVGKLGLAMAALYASVGHRVIGVDIDEGRIEQLTIGRFHTDEPGVDDLLRTNAERLKFDRTVYPAVIASQFVFIVVPTPSNANGTFTSEHVVKACRQVGVALHDKDAFTVVVVVSTLMPGQMEADVLPALERASEKRCGSDFGLCYSPEFIALGRILQGLREPDYILIGAVDERVSTALSAFYRETIGTGVGVSSMNFINAELAKLATNAYLSLKIAYANVLGQICGSLPGANVDEVTRAVGRDHRIGSAYLRAGLPAGGVCLPRDLNAFSLLAENASVGQNTVGFFERMNDDVLVSILCDSERAVDPDIEFADYTGCTKTVGVLGTGYSATTSITEASYALKLRDWLRDDGFTVIVPDTAQQAQAFVDTVDAVVLALPLDEYKALQFHSGQRVIDLWRVLDPAKVPDAVMLYQFGVGTKTGAHVE